MTNYRPATSDVLRRLTEAAAGDQPAESFARLARDAADAIHSLVAESATLRDQLDRCLMSRESRY